MDSYEHPLATTSTTRKSSSSPVPFPSPPLSPSDERDIEAFAADVPALDYRSGGFLSQALSGTSSDRDPLLLKSKLQTDEHITELTHRRSTRSRKDLGDFYSRQNRHIYSLLKPMDKHIEESQADEDANRTAIKIAVWASLICNCVLAILQIYAAVSSLSLSFFATAIDAIFDPAANLVLHYCHRKAQTVDLQKFPSGGSKFETIGDIVYSLSMGSVSIVLVAFSIQSLARGAPAEDGRIHIPAVVAVGIAFFTKLCLFLYCFSLRNKSSQVHVLWEDHRNDLAINGFGIFTSCAGAKVAWFIDPMGAMIISFVLIGAWGHTCYGHFGYLAGKAAPLEFQQLVIYNAMTFAEGIEQIDSCVVYHAGPDYVVEVDIVMASETPLWKAHDISQALQDKLEELPRVDRAFVHVDHETSHKPEHRKTK